MIRFYCERCGNTLQVPDSGRGKRARCECGAVQRVPSRTPPELRSRPRVRKVDSGKNLLIDCPRCHALLRTPNVDDQKRIRCECGSLFRLPEARAGRITAAARAEPEIFEAQPVAVASSQQSTLERRQQPVRRSGSQEFPSRQGTGTATFPAQPARSQPPSPPATRPKKQGDSDAVKSLGTGCLMVVAAILWFAASLFFAQSISTYAIMLFLFGMFTLFQGLFGVATNR